MGLRCSTPGITSFQKIVVKTFLTDLKDNIASQFSTQDVVAAFSILNPKVIPDVTSEKFTTYGEMSVDTLIKHYETTKTVETVKGDEFM